MQNTDIALTSNGDGRLQLTVTNRSTGLVVLMVRADAVSPLWAPAWLEVLRVVAQNNV